MPHGKGIGTAQGSWNRKVKPMDADEKMAKKIIMSNQRGGCFRSLLIVIVSHQKYQNLLYHKSISEKMDIFSREVFV